MPKKLIVTPLLSMVSAGIDNFNLTVRPDLGFPYVSIDYVEGGAAVIQASEGDSVTTRPLSESELAAVEAFIAPYAANAREAFVHSADAEGNYRYVPESQAHVVLDAPPPSRECRYDHAAKQWTREVTRAMREAEVRRERDARMKQSDWTQLADVKLSTEKRAEWKAHRQQLRDITEHPNFPDLRPEDWPAPPA